MTDRPKLCSGPVFADGPFRVMDDTLWIVGTDAYGGTCHVADIRGWGYLTGRGQALALTSDEAIAAQARAAQFIVDAMNEKLARDQASSPEVQALIAEARREGWNAAKESAAQLCWDKQVSHHIKDGYVLDDFWHEHGGTHPGMAYTSAIRALKEETP